MTKQRRRWLRELEQEKIITIRKVYRGKRWLAEFATGIRLMELAWSGRVRYSRLGG